jgi:hypothetical protein
MVLQLNLSTGETSIVKVYDIKGVLLKELKAVSSTNLDLSFLIKGHYKLAISTGVRRFTKLLKV